MSLNPQCTGGIRIKVYTDVILAFEIVDFLKDRFTCILYLRNIYIYFFFLNLENNPIQMLTF